MITENQGTAIFIGIVIAIPMYLGLSTRRRALRKYSETFSPRADLSKDALVAAFDPAGSFDRDDVLLLLDAIAEHLNVPVGKLRPTDDFQKELKAPGLDPGLTLQGIGMLVVKRFRKKYPQMQALPLESTSLNALVPAFLSKVESAS